VAGVAVDAQGCPQEQPLNQIILNQVDTANCPVIREIVAVTDRDGNPINNLTAADFRVLEDGVVQGQINVTAVGDSSIGASVALTLDFSGSMNPPAVAAMKEAANNFINQLQQNDSAEIIKFAATVEVTQAFTSDLALMNTSIYNKPYTGDIFATAFYDATYKAIDDTKTKPGRLAIIAMTDGADNASTKSLQDVIDHAVASGVPIFTVGLGLVNDAVLQKLAVDTGGVYYPAPTPDDLAAIYSSIAMVLQNQYVLEYLSLIHI